MLTCDYETWTSRYEDELQRLKVDAPSEQRLTAAAAARQLADIFPESDFEGLRQTLAAAGQRLPAGWQATE